MTGAGKLGSAKAPTATAMTPGTSALVYQTVDPQTFVTTLCGAVKRNHMESRSDIQSFDFRTLILVEEQYPNIPTYYLTQDPRMLSTEFVPVPLRLTPTAQ